MAKTQRLMNKWRGMAPDSARDEMGEGQTWLMQDYIPLLLGSKLESRQGWKYWVTSPLDGYITAQLWVNTVSRNAHLAATRTTIYNLDVPATPRVVTASAGALWPMTALYEYVMIPRDGNQQPVFLRYPAAPANEVIVTPHATIPKGKVATTWLSRFVLANGQDNASIDHPQRLYFLTEQWDPGLTATPPWDLKAWADTSADVTGLAVTRTSMLIFHEGSIERMRGTKPPGTNVAEDVWLEPVQSNGGCNEPHTICYWNDNVIFADARGVSMTDGTTIRDITTQGGIGEEWRRAYDPVWRVSAGIYKNQYIITMVDVTNLLFKKCFVCDLNSRNWQVFTNIPVASFVVSAGEKEKLFGGGVDGKVIDLTSMYDRADPTSDTVDGNSVAVLPQLETAWYRMSENTQMKRVKNIYMDFDLTETTGQIKVYGCEQVQPGSPSDWVLLKTIQEGDIPDNRGVGIDIEGYRRRRIPVGRQSYGMAFKIETVGQLRKLKLFDLAVELVPSREETYAGATVNQ